MLNNSNLKADWGMIRPGEDMPIANSLELACRLIGNEHRLTSREVEILVLLAKGKNRAVISDLLTLSKNTTKTHIKKHYQKLNIHPQQELIILVDQKTYSFIDGGINLPTTAF
jgi:DNA-binding NarL/FixJ family response regulator